MRRVAITGMGVVSPVGNTVETVWNNLLAGKSGVRTITKFDTSAFKFPVTIAGEVDGFDPALYMDPKTARRAALFTQYGVAAAKMAAADSGIDFQAEPDPYRCGCLVSSGVGGIDITESETLRMYRNQSWKVNPFSIPEMIADMAAGIVSIELGLRGPNFGVVSACATGLHSIGLAMRAIRYGEADVMLAGGCEAPITPVAVAGFAALHALSTSNEEPAKACRPFDAGRNGFIMAEGGAVLVLEEMERAKARGAKIYAEVAGFGMTGDAYHMTAPMEGGAAGAKAMELALAEAGVPKDGVDYVNAHGTSTPMNDKTETAAFKLALGEENARKVAISSTKSMTGHMLGGTGAFETAVCALAISRGVVPPTINYETPDPACDLDYVPNVAREMKVDVALNNSLGFGGHNAVAVLKRA